MLNTLNILDEYRTGEEDPLTFYIDCLKQSKTFDRSAGYFSSSGLAMAAKGFAHFINDGGQIRLVVHPEFSQEDIDAIREGYSNLDLTLDRILLNSISNIENKIVKNRFDAIAWLIANGQLDIKIALKTDSKGLPTRNNYHEKFGVFTDSHGNKIAFSGSSNETGAGRLNNFESIDVFKAWENEKDKGRVIKKEENFNKLWNNQTSLLSVRTLPDNIKDVIIRQKGNTTPNTDPEEPNPDVPYLNVPDFARTSYETGIKYPNWLEEKGLRPYQRQHVDLWMSSCLIYCTF